MEKAWSVVITWPKGKTRPLKPFRDWGENIAYHQLPEYVGIFLFVPGKGVGVGCGRTE